MAQVELGSTTLASDANLKAYYKLEDTSDSSGNSKTLTNNGTTPFNTAKFGNGADGGSSDNNRSLSIADNLGFTGGAYSISLWAKASTNPSSGNLYNVIELFDGGNDVSLLIEYENSGGTMRLNFHRLRVGTADASFSYNVDISDTFHNIIIAYDATTLKGYVDTIATSTVGATGNGSSATATKFNIMAGRADNVTNNFLGIVDDVGCFDRELLAADINLIFNGPVTSTPSGSFNFV